MWSRTVNETLMGRCYRASASIGIYGFSDDGFTLRLMLPDAGSHTYEDGSLSKTFQSHKQAVAWAKSQGFKEPPARPATRKGIRRQPALNIW